MESDMLEMGVLQVSNLKGLLLEPMNVSNTVSEKYYLDDKERVELLGRKDTRPELGTFEIEKMAKFFEDNNLEEGTRLVQ